MQGKFAELSLKKLQKKVAQENLIVVNLPNGVK